jgi:lipid II:glycine glycyltransferase (peptidoglycan interpeptide bridge formation enzyme)
MVPSRVVSIAETQAASAYDRFVAESPQGSVFCTSWWLDAVAPGSWRAHEVEEKGRIVAAWPTVVRATRLGLAHAGAPLTPFLGPLFPPGEGARRRSREFRLVDSLLERIGRYAHLEARCNPAFDYWTPLRWHGFEQTTHYTWRLNDLSDLDAVFAGFRENIRGHIRAAEKNGMTVEETGLGELLDVHRRRFAREPQGIARIDGAARARGARTVLVARDEEGTARAAGYFVHDERFTTYLLAATDAEVRGAAALVLWEAIKRAAERGTAFDFEGSMLQHVEPFVRSFGGVPTPYSIVLHTPSAPFRAARGVKRALRRQ